MPDSTANSVLTDEESFDVKTATLRNGQEARCDTCGKLLFKYLRGTEMKGSVVIETVCPSCHKNRRRFLIVG